MTFYDRVKNRTAQLNEPDNEHNMFEINGLSIRLS